jgi:hypothetical protein
MVLYGVSDGYSARVSLDMVKWTSVGFDGVIERGLAYVTHYVCRLEYIDLWFPASLDQVKVAGVG